MIVFPVKALPWLLLIGGLCGIISGEAPFFSILLALAGGAWVYYIQKNKKTAK